MHQRGEIEQVRGLVVDFDGLACGCIDARDDVVRPIAAELVLDAPCAGGHGVGDLARLRLIGNFHEHLARAAHRAEAADPQAVVARERLELEVVAELQDHRVEVRHLRVADLIADQHFGRRLGRLPVELQSSRSIRCLRQSRGRT